MNKKIDILLIGGGGHCRSVIDVIEVENRFNIVGIIDKEELIGKKIFNYQIIGSDNDLEKLSRKYKYAFITIGHIQSNEVRIRLFQYLKSLGYIIPTIISPLAYVSKYASINEGTIVMHNAFVNAKVEIGKNCIINTKALIEHDVIIGDNCHISTGAILNGGVTVDENLFIGSNSVSKESIKIKFFVKAGSVVK